MNRRINSIWIEASLYEISFISKKNNVHFDRLCVYPIKWNERKIERFFLNEFKDIDELRVRDLGETWVSRNLMDFL